MQARHLWRNALAAIGAAFTLVAAAHGDDAGKIIQSIGDVRLGGVPAKVGDTVRAGDALATGSDGYMYLQTVDGGFFILRPRSDAKVLAYHIDAGQPANTRIKFELRQGVARSISGQAVKASRENFRLNTPVAAIGVRGTDFTVFTDEQTTRIAVVAGGVVVSGFGAGCGPEGAGPCEGSSKRELYAGQGGQVLQVIRGQAVPQLLHGSALTPDAVAPSRGDEPAKTGGSASAANIAGAGLANGNAEPNLAPLKFSNLDKLTPPPPAAPPGPPAIVWGRWQPLADLPANIDTTRLQAEYQRIAMDSYYVLLRNKESLWQAPTDGKASFALQSHQALVRDERGGQPAAAMLENGKLMVDFTSSRFSTQFDLLIEGQRIARLAEGNVFKDGTFGNFSQFLGNNNMLVQGVLANDPGLRAAYLFQSRIDDNRVASGITSWAK